MKARGSYLENIGELSPPRRWLRYRHGHDIVGKYHLAEVGSFVYKYALKNTFNLQS